MEQDFLVFEGDYSINFEDLDKDQDSTVPDILDLIQKLKNENSEIKLECIQQINKLDWQLEVMINDEKYELLCAAVFEAVMDGIQESQIAMEKLTQEITHTAWAQVISKALEYFVGECDDANKQFWKEEGIRDAAVFLVNSLKQMADKWVFIREDAQKIISLQFANFVQPIISNQGLTELISGFDDRFLFWQRNVSRIPILKQIIQNMGNNLLNQICAIISHNKKQQNFLIFYMYIVVGIYWYGNSTQLEQIHQSVKLLVDDQSGNLLRSWQIHLQEMDIIDNGQISQDLKNVKNWIIELENE